MLTRGGADQTGGADQDRVPGYTWRPALGSGGARHGILTLGVPAGIPPGTQIRGVTGAIGTVAETPQKRSRLGPGCVGPTGNCAIIPGRST
jgi:hypothetical protein